MGPRLGLWFPLFAGMLSAPVFAQTSPAPTPLVPTPLSPGNVIPPPTIAPSPMQATPFQPLSPAPAPSAAQPAPAPQPGAVPPMDTATLPPPPKIKIAQPAAKRAPGPPQPAAFVPHTLAEALAATYSYQPALQAERAKLRATDENVPAALAGWRPTVQLTGAAGYGNGLTRSLQFRRAHIAFHQHAGGARHRHGGDAGAANAL